MANDGWQVFTPVLDNGHQTDILISDGPNYHRIQVKTVEASGEDHVVENRWKDSNVDVVILFARNETVYGIVPRAHDWVEYSCMLKVKDGGKFPVSLEMKFIPPHPFAFNMPLEKSLTSSPTSVLQTAAKAERKGIPDS